MKNLGVALSGGHGNRRDKDFYPTPPEAVVALLEAGILPASGRVWEPACGDGAISRILERYRYGVVSTDLVDRGFGNGGVDFLETDRLLAPNIVTNPPFSLAEKFIRHALGLGAETLALLLKAQYWHAASRLDLFEKHRPSVIAPLTWRLDFTGGGAPTMDCAWVVWNKHATTPPLYLPLRKPKPLTPTLDEMVA